MDLTQALLTILLALVTIEIANTNRRLGRLERDMAQVKVQLALKPDRSELNELRTEVTNGLAAMRTDLTQIALAVGARRASGD